MPDRIPVLIVTYYFPPAGGPGVQRILKFCKYLTEHNLQPVVLTVRNGEYPNTDLSLMSDVADDLPVYQTPIVEPYRFYKRFTCMKQSDSFGVAFVKKEKSSAPSWKEKLALWIRGNLFIPDARFLWKWTAIPAGLDIIKKHGIRAIVTTGPPHSTHGIGRSLKKRTGLPWLADFRDPWTGIDYYSKFPLTRWADRKHRRLESAVLNEADEVVVVSKSMKTAFAALTDTPITVIPNGYDDAELPVTPPKPPADSWVVGYVGNMYPVRNWETVATLFASMVTQSPAMADRFRLKLIGNEDGSVIDRFEQAGLGPYLIRKGYMPHDQAIQELFTCHALLLVINDEPGNTHVLTGKLFEYLGTGRPILFSGPVPGDAWDLLSQTGRAVNLGEGFILPPFADLEKQPVLTAFTRRSLTRQLALRIKTMIHQQDHHHEES